MKRYNWEQEQIRHMKEYIARFGHGSAKLAKQAQSKEKTLAKMERAGLTKKVRVVSFVLWFFALFPLWTYRLHFFVCCVGCRYLPYLFLLSTAFLLFVSFLL